MDIMQECYGGGDEKMALIPFENDRFGLREL